MAKVATLSASRRNEIFRSLYSVDDLATLLGTPQRRLLGLLYKSGPHYRLFEVPKRNGGVRQIAKPSRAIGACQRIILDCIQDIYRPLSCVHGFVRGKSIVTNAAVHLPSRVILNLDLEDFFPSINFGRVFGVFQAGPFRFPKNVAAVLARLCCFQNQLPQGAPTSPVIANLICRGLDRELSKLSRSGLVRYTRYADDITFSTIEPQLPPDILKTSEPLELSTTLRETIERHGFCVAAGKTRVATRRDRQEVTGVTVNERLNVERHFIRNLRAGLHHWRVLGEIKANERFQTGRVENQRSSIRDHLRGRLSFLKMVKGEQDPVYFRYAADYAELAGESPPRLVGDLLSNPEVVCSALWIIVGYSLSGEEVCSGTGFSIDETSIVTAEHILDKRATSWFVHPAWSAAKRLEVSEALCDPHFDLALIKSPIPPRAVLTIHAGLGSAERPSVRLLGYPKWHPAHHNVRIECGAVVAVKTVSCVNTIEISADIHEGNSGGPIVDDHGSVLAVARTSVGGAIANSGVAAHHIAERLVSGTAELRKLKKA